MRLRQMPGGLSGSAFSASSGTRKPPRARRIDVQASHLSIESNLADTLAAALIERVENWIDSLPEDEQGAARDVAFERGWLG